MRKIILPAYVLLIIILSACNSTRITSVWREVDKKVSLNKLNKVLVVAFFSTETARHKSEDQMVMFLDGKGVASYNYLAAGFDKKNETALRNKINYDGFDGAITMRLVDVEKEKSYFSRDAYYPPPYNRSFGGYYYWNMPFYSSPDYFAATKTYTVETNVFSIKEDKIIWSGITKTTDPEGVNKMMEEIVLVIYKRMLKEGFISKK